jgi:hypothetical protein
LYGAETGTFRSVDYKYLEGFEMFWRRMEKVSQTDCVKNEEVKSMGKGIFCIK